jgi:hypothetical protein
VHTPLFPHNLPSELEYVLFAQLIDEAPQLSKIGSIEMSMPSEIVPLLVTM